MGELGALFNPGMRHELEERRAKAARREEEGNARDGDLRIDLESGVAVINAPEDDDAAAADDRSNTNVRSDAAESDSAESGAAGSGASAPPSDGFDAGESDPARSDAARSDAARSDAARSDAAGSDGGPAAEAGPAAEPAPLRPRGKRATTAARR
jgi:hypothetical protein